MPVGGPVLQIGSGGAREAVDAEVSAQMEQLILKLQGQFGFGQGADVRLDVGAIEETRDQRPVIGPEHAPGGMALPQAIERLEVSRSGLCSGVGSRRQAGWLCLKRSSVSKSIAVDYPACWGRVGGQTIDRWMDRATNRLCGT